MDNKLNQEKINDNKGMDQSESIDAKEVEIKNEGVSNNLSKEGMLNILYILGVASSFLNWLNLDYDEVNMFYQSVSKSFDYTLFSSGFSKRYAGADLLYLVPLAYVVLIINNIMNEKTKNIVEFFLASVATSVVGLYFIDIFISDKAFTVGIGAKIAFTISLFTIFMSFTKLNKSSDFKVEQESGILNWLEYYYKNTFNFSGVEKYPYYWRYEVFLAGLYALFGTFVSLAIIVVIEVKKKAVSSIIGTVFEIFFLVIYLPSIALFLRYLKNKKEKNTDQIINDNLDHKNNISNGNQLHPTASNVDPNQGLQNDNIDSNRENEIYRNIQANPTQVSHPEQNETQETRETQAVANEVENKELPGSSKEEVKYSPFGDKLAKLVKKNNSDK